MEQEITQEALQSIQLQELSQYLSDLENSVTEMNSHWETLKMEERKVAEHATLLLAGERFFQVGKSSLLAFVGSCYCP
jgi:hypothetical protein